MYYLSNVPEALTSEWILTKIRQEDIYERYLEITPSIGKKYTNPLRDDSKPDCSFHWYNGLLWFTDFPKNKQYTCFIVVMEKYGLTWYQALEKIVRDMISNTSRYEASYRLHASAPKQKEEKDIQVTIQKFTKTDLSYLKKFHITLATLKKYRVFSVQHYWINGALKYTYSAYNPCIGYYFGNGKWKLYFYQSKEWRFITNVSGDMLQGFDQLPLFGDRLIITKSQKDIMVFSEMGYDSVAPHTEAVPNNISSLSWYQLLRNLQKRFPKIYLNFDNDATGIESTNRLLEAFPDLNSLLLPETTGCKDISDHAKDYGLEQTKQLLNTLIIH